jgi:hypothetical protein
MTLVSKQPYMYYLVHTIHLPAGANKRRLNRGLVVLTVVVTVVDVVVAASATACAAFAAACAASAAACSTTGDDDVVVVVVVVATVVRSDCRRRRLWGVARDVPVRCRVLRVGRVVGEVRARRGRSLAWFLVGGGDVQFSSTIAHQCSFLANACVSLLSACKRAHSAARS